MHIERDDLSRPAVLALLIEHLSNMYELSPPESVHALDVLADSFAFCDDAFAATTDQNAMTFVRQGPNELTRAMVLFGLLAHNAEMYGIGTVYLRLKGIVPPSTERQSGARGRGASGQ